MLKKVFLAGLVCLISQAVFAQVVPASRGSASGRFQVGGGFSAYNTDWDGWELGFTGYGDMDVYRHLISLEGEARFLFIGEKNGTMHGLTPPYASVGSYHLVTENNYGIGPRITFTRGRWLPYAKVLAGVSTISFGHTFAQAPNYTHDSYTYFAIGGGVERKMTAHLRLRAEYQQQFYLSDGSAFTGDHHKNTFVFMPAGGTIGMAYHF